MAKRRPSGDGMVRKREDGRWEGRIVVGHKENGEPIFRYVLAKTQKELLAKLHRDMDIYQDAQLTEDSRMTLGEWMDRWMEEYGAVTLRPNTLRSYEQYIRCYVKPYLGGKIVSRVTRLDIQKLYRKLKKEGRVHDHPEYGHELSDSMVLRIHAMLQPLPQGCGTGSHRPLQPNGRCQAAQEQLQTKAGSRPGADGCLPGGSGQKRNLAGLLLHGVDTLACVEVRSAVSCGGTSTRTLGR